ncbi:hypothetical protein FS320_00990 [Microvirga tunisiensis]|uniref:Uncharacterized protein n=2 Tax=Microvirga tunisiensis TaxID=2108360 RepID=A0A5N7MB20_9HYPH|nr:hypothetical protein [Microvirga tunisiensis]MPR23830.1 hypothetical protein [Microvirga tunisiensis]
MLSKPDLTSRAVFVALTVTSAAYAVPVSAQDLSGEAARVAFVEKACGPDETNAAIGEAFFGNLSRYMEVNNRANEARRLDAIRTREKEEFRSARARIVQAIAAEIKNNITDPQWFAKLSSQMNGDGNAFSFISAARQVVLAELKGSSEFFYEVNQAATSAWTSQDVSPLSAEKMKQVTGFTGTLQTIMLSIPANAFEFFVNNKPYRIYWAGPIGPTGSYVSKQADEVMKKSADETIDAITGKNQFFGRYLKQAYFSTKQSAGREPSPIEGAIWAAHLCVSYQIGVSNDLFSTDTINNVYIKNLKDRGSW